VKIAIWQTAASLRDPDGAARLGARAAEAAAAGATVLVVPECFTSGYHIPDMASVAQPADGSWATTVSDVAREVGIAIAYGSPEATDDGVLNVARLVDASGNLLTEVVKTHLYGDIDRSMFVPGRSLAPIVEFDGLKVGMLICYDVEFPETVRSLALAGADVVLVPTALMAPEESIAKVVVPTRALENQVVLAYANRVGREQELTYVGLSCVVGPDGADLARAGDGDELVLADVDPATLAIARAAYNQLRDRRPDLYGSLVDEGGAR
jgi:predicted amidohydrolase